MKFHKPRGTRDILPNEMEARRKLENCIRNTFESYGYREVSTPTFEFLDLITAKSGQEIRERLYDFKDKSGREFALRPELTAPTMRLYVDKLQVEPKPVRLYYLGNCFRYDRPQSGRYREFRQAGIELIGSPYPNAEGEVIAVAIDVLQTIDLDFDIHIGHIGILRAILNEFGVENKEHNAIMNAIDKGEEVEKFLENIDLNDENKQRLLSLINLKGPKDGVIKSARNLLNGLKSATTELDKFEEFINVLKGYNIKSFIINLGIARGLDYYTGMVFEIYSKKLGAEKQICGGGTYTLTNIVGGIKTPTIGFAFGFDRIDIALKNEKKFLIPEYKAKCLVVATGDHLLNTAINVSQMLRKNNLCELEIMKKKLKRALNYANQKGFTHVAIVGDDELEQKCISLRNMVSGIQEKIKIEELSDLELK